MPEQDGIIGKIGKKEKLENPVRVAELDPVGTLEKIGFHAGETLCDIGAGSGIFSLAAAGMEAEKVWAVDTDEDILTDLKARTAKVPCLVTVPAEGCSYPLEDQSADWVLLVTVLHEIAEKQTLLSEIRRILKTDGTVCLIEFRKMKTPLGRPSENRISEEEAAALFAEAGFRREENYIMGKNFYCQTYRQVRAS